MAQKGRAVRILPYPANVNARVIGPNHRHLAVTLGMYQVNHNRDRRAMVNLLEEQEWTVEIDGQRGRGWRNVLTLGDDKVIEGLLLGNRLGPEEGEFILVHFEQLSGHARVTSPVAMVTGCDDITSLTTRLGIASELAKL